MPKQKPGRSKQDYGTPHDFLLNAKEMLGIQQWDIDLAATWGNRVCPRFFGPADCEDSVGRKELVGRDALAHSWKQGEGWNWLNPPYARIAPWVEKAWEEWVRRNARTAVLVPAGVGANWWAKWVHGKARVLLLNGRITFNGEAMPYPKDCALLLYGAGDGPGYTVWTWKKGREGFDKT